MSSRGSLTLLPLPWKRCSTRPASRSTRKWCVRVALETGRSKEPQGDDPPPVRVGQGREHGLEVRRHPGFPVRHLRSRPSAP